MQCWMRLLKLLTVACVFTLMVHADPVTNLHLNLTFISGATQPDVNSTTASSVSFAGVANGWSYNFTLSTNMATTDGGTTFSSPDPFALSLSGDASCTNTAGCNGANLEISASWNDSSYAGQTETWSSALSDTGSDAVVTVGNDAPGLIFVADDVTITDSSPYSANGSFSGTGHHFEISDDISLPASQANLGSSFTGDIFAFQSPATDTSVPEPGTLGFFATGLTALVGVVRRHARERMQG